MNDGAWLNSVTEGGGKGGDVTINASESVVLSGNNDNGDGSLILALTYNESIDSGDAGNISIETKNLGLNNGAWIDSGTSGGGKGGDVTINASESVELSGNSLRNFPSVIVANTLSKESDSGDAGNILIKTKNLSLNDGVRISSFSNGGGKGGDISIFVSESAILSGNSAYDGGGSMIATDAENTNIYAGNAGDIQIEAKKLSLSDGAEISTISKGGGKGGDIIINTLKSIDFMGSRIFAETLGQNADSGNAGNIKIETETLTLSDKGVISTSTEGSGKANNIYLDVNRIQLTDSVIASASMSGETAGDAGEIIIGSERPSESVTLRDNSAITTRAENAGGGKMSISVNDALHISDSQITTSVQYGKGDGGDIAISDPEFVTLNQSDILARAYEGNGGNIDISADTLIRSSDSTVNASSTLVIDGEINLESPEADLTGALTDLPANYLDAAPVSGTRGTPAETGTPE